MKKTILFAAAALLLAASCCHKNATTTADAVMANILSRKSVRSYTADSVPAAVIDNLLRAAMAAPSGMDIRPWSFVVLTDKSQYDSVFEGNFNMRMFKESAAVIVLCADTTVTRPPRDNPEGAAVTMPNPIWRDDMGAATENLLLAAEAHGLGACWTACYPFADRMDPIRRALQLPANVVPYSVVPVGVPAGDNQPKDKWDPSRIRRL
ncbi:MAG: nitroreductase family protein [Bacteroidales bacterium]|nr:nitroreductase family protein [Bacteroidales bacterium]